MQTSSYPAEDVVHMIKAHTTRLLLRRRLSLVALMLVIGMLVAACGGGSSDEPAASTETSGEEAPAAQEAPPADEGEAADEEGSPADELPGDEEFGLTMDELLKAIDDTEAQIAQCMSEAGFEYVAVDSNTVREGVAANEASPGLTEEQFHNQYGYGISTLYTGHPPQLSDVSTPATIGLGEQNVAIFQGLSATDQVAYNQTLFGEYSDAPLAVALDLEDFSRTGGCTRTAIEQVFPTETLNASYINPKDFLVYNDERVIEAFAQYAGCMKEAGFEISREEEIGSLITNRLDEITGGAPVESLSADAQAAFAELQDFERAISTASFACETEFVEPAEAEVEEELFGAQ